LDSIENHIYDEGVDDARLEVIGDSSYAITPSGEPEESDSEYLLMGRGYLDRYNYGAIEDQPVGGLTSRSWHQKSLNRGTN
jgi:hypothetical protein